MKFISFVFAALMLDCLCLGCSDLKNCTLVTTTMCEADAFNNHISCPQTCKVCDVCDGAYYDYITFGLIGTSCNKKIDGEIKDADIRFSDKSKWAGICQQWKAQATCLRDDVVDRHAPVQKVTVGDQKLVLSEFPYLNMGDSRLDSLYQFPAQVCDDGGVKTGVNNYKADVSCLTNAEKTTYYNCFKNVDCKVEKLYTATPMKGSAELISATRELSVEAFRCMVKVSDNSKCDAERKKFIEFLSKLQIYSIDNVDEVEETVRGGSVTSVTAETSVTSVTTTPLTSTESSATGPTRRLCFGVLALFALQFVVKIIIAAP